jgi:hypothetical protein
MLDLTLAVGRRFADNAALTGTWPGSHVRDGNGKALCGIVQRSMAALGWVTAEGQNSSHG